MGLGTIPERCHHQNPAQVEHKSQEHDPPKTMQHESMLPGGQHLPDRLVSRASREKCELFHASGELAPGSIMAAGQEAVARARGVGSAEMVHFCKCAGRGDGDKVMRGAQSSLKSRYVSTITLAALILCTRVGHAGRRPGTLGKFPRPLARASDGGVAFDCKRLR